MIFRPSSTRHAGSQAYRTRSAISSRHGWLKLIQTISSVSFSLATRRGQKRSNRSNCFAPKSCQSSASVRRASAQSPFKNFRAQYCVGRPSCPGAMKVMHRGRRGIVRRCTRRGDIRSPGRTGSPWGAISSTEYETPQSTFDRAKPRSSCGLVCGSIPKKWCFYKENKQKWRRGWDSNPRYPRGHNGFRDRPDRPLWHLSASAWSLWEAADTSQ